MSIKTDIIINKVNKSGILKLNELQLAINYFIKFILKNEISDTVVINSAMQSASPFDKKVMAAAFIIHKIHDSFVINMTQDDYKEMSLLQQIILEGKLELSSDTQEFKKIYSIANRMFTDNIMKIGAFSDGRILSANPEINMFGFSCRNCSLSHKCEFNGYDIEKCLLVNLTNTELPENITQDPISEDKIVILREAIIAAQYSKKSNIIRQRS